MKGINGSSCHYYRRSEWHRRGSRAGFHRGRSEGRVLRHPGRSKAKRSQERDRFAERFCLRTICGATRTSTGLVQLTRVENLAASIFSSTRRRPTPTRASNSDRARVAERLRHQPFRSRHAGKAGARAFAALAVAVDRLFQQRKRACRSGGTLDLSCHQGSHRAGRRAVRRSISPVDGIRVNAVMPGWTEKPWHKTAPQDTKDRYADMSQPPAHDRTPGHACRKSPMRCCSFARSMPASSPGAVYGSMADIPLWDRRARRSTCPPKQDGTRASRSRPDVH